MVKRLLIFIPEINTRTFLFFYEKGSTGRSYSLRDYAGASGVQVTYARHYSLSAAQIVATAKHVFDAPAHDVNDVGYWREQILDLNHRYLSHADGMSQNPVCRMESPGDGVAADPTGTAASTTTLGLFAGSATGPVHSSSPHQGAYPVLAESELRTHAVKGGKPQDLERIFFSKRSEDWVTWNVVKLLSWTPATEWWPAMCALARAENPALSITVEAWDVPRIESWVLVPSPAEYERLSRVRMTHSGNPDWVARSSDPRPVEGASEVDIVLLMRNQICFVEAKLGSDISMTTTYDPRRNQIARNVDCLLEYAGSRTPFFWMFAADRGPGRAYTQLMHRYREDPEVLVADLPHRDPEAVRRVALNMAIVLWKDVLPLIDSGLRQVLDELRMRVNSV